MGIEKEIHEAMMYSKKGIAPNNQRNCQLKTMNNIKSSSLTSGLPDYVT